MAKIDKHQLGQLKEEVGFDEVGEYPKKKVRLINDNKQIRIRVPKNFVKAMKIDEKKDHFEFRLIPKEDGGFELEGVLIKG